MLKVLKFIQSKKKLILTLGTLLLCIIYFWMEFRYPRLNEKEAMQDRINPGEVLSFDVKYPIKETDPLWEKVGKTTLNWSYTNKNGMLFGVIFAAIFLTLLELIRKIRPRTSNRYLNTLIGTLIGVPLGVCANCATPIGQGMQKSGEAPETVLATIHSSPSLNIIVLTMLFNLFSFDFAIIKLTSSLLFIFFVIPYLTSIFMKDSGPEINTVCPVDFTTDETWFQATKYVASQMLRNLFYIVKRTVPMMFLAGFLAAIMVEVLSLNFLSYNTDEILSYMTIALLATFLPVPIMLDLVIGFMLLKAGLNPGLVMTLVFCLGMYSIYPFFIIYRNMSKQLAVALYVLVMGVGVLAGQVMSIRGHYVSKQNKAMIKNILAKNKFTKEEEGLRKKETRKLVPQTVSPKQIYKINDLVIKSFSYKDKSPQKKGDKLFTKMFGSSLGIDYQYKARIVDENPPFRMEGGITAGDFNNDHWPDLALGTSSGVVLYINRRNGTFQRSSFDFKLKSPNHIFIVALVDINNDKKLDLFGTSYSDQNFFFLGNGKTFDPKPYIFPKTNIILSMAASFADWDKDGDLDLGLGNWSYGMLNTIRIANETSRNQLYSNTGTFPFFKEKKYEDPIKGATLSFLFSDLTQDGNTDMLVGTDFDFPDDYYWGSGDGNFKRIKNSDNLITNTAQFTMGLDTADINNDLKLELFATDLQVDGLWKDDFYCRHIGDKKEQAECQKHFVFHRILNDGEDENCELAKGQKNQCLLAKVLNKIILSGERDDCLKLPPSSSHPSLQEHCVNAKEIELMMKNYKGKTAARRYEQIDSIKQIGSKNLLLVRNQKNKFIDESDKYGVSKSDWSWNGKFADLDNDEWQDLYVGNGHHFFETKSTSNVFYYNNKGKKFTKEQDKFGLSDFVHTISFVYVDYDLDGDLDIISTGTYAPIRVFKNNLQKNHSLSFSFLDEKGNSFGIGNKIYVYYEGHKQMREIKSGGGFLSFDDSIAHFGLGAYDKVDKIIIEWSTGEKSVVEKEFKAGHRYIIERKKDKI